MAYALRSSEDEIGPQFIPSEKALFIRFGLIGLCWSRTEPNSTLLNSLPSPIPKAYAILSDQISSWRRGVTSGQRARCLTQIM
jgi:hypothetical protein